MQRRQVDLRTFDELRAEVDRLHRNGYTQLGQWNLAQMCDHLVQLMRRSLEGFDFRFPWVMRTIVGPYVLKPIVLRRRWFPAGADAPKPLVPRDGGNEAAAVREFNEMCDWVEQSDRFYPSPALGYLTPDQWRQVHLIHASHHIGHLVPREPSRRAPAAAPAVQLRAISNR